MGARFQSRPDRRSGPILASVLVMFMGALAVAVVVTSSGANPYLGLLAFVAFAAIAPLMGILFRATPQRTLSSLYSWMRKSNAAPEEEYRPQVTRTKRKYGTNRPPSVDELRELKDGSNNWVPSNVPQPSRRRKKS